MLLWEGDINFTKSAHTCANTHKYIHDNPTHCPQLSFCLSRHHTKGNTGKTEKLWQWWLRNKSGCVWSWAFPLNHFFLTCVMAAVSLTAAFSLQTYFISLKETEGIAMSRISGCLRLSVDRIWELYKLEAPKILTGIYTPPSLGSSPHCLRFGDMELPFGVAWARPGVT